MRAWWRKPSPALQRVGPERAREAHVGRCLQPTATVRRAHRERTKGTRSVGSPYAPGRLRTSCSTPLGPCSLVAKSTWLTAVGCRRALGSALGKWARRAVKPNFLPASSSARPIGVCAGDPKPLPFCGNLTITGNNLDLRANWGPPSRRPSCDRSWGSLPSAWCGLGMPHWLVEARPQSTVRALWRRGLSQLHLGSVPASSSGPNVAGCLQTSGGSTTCPAGRLDRTNSGAAAEFDAKSRKFEQERKSASGGYAVYLRPRYVGSARAHTEWQIRSRRFSRIRARPEFEPGRAEVGSRA